MTAIESSRRVPPAALEETGFLVRLAHVRATELRDAELPPGAQPRYGEVLAVLAELGSRSQQQLAALLDINRTIMVSLIDSMEGASLVERHRDPGDRRSYALSPTDAGRGALAAMTEAAQRADAALTEPLTGGERRRLDRLLRDIAAENVRFTELPASLTESTSQLLGLAHDAIRSRFESLLADAGLTTPLYGTLRTLEASGPTSQQSIAGQLGLTGTAILQTVDKLEQRALVIRRRSPTDRRAYALELTAKGRAALRRARDAQQASEQRLDVAVGGASESGQLRRLLLKLLEAAG
jgi:DNA-binding MarR family transcriptional regulator